MSNAVDAGIDVVNGEDRVAFQYWGDQETGALIEWPATQWCPDECECLFIALFRDRRIFTEKTT